MAITASVLEDIDEPGGIVRVARAAASIATHLRPDLDALLGVWMLQRIRARSGISPAEVLFVSANVKGVGRDVLAVDIGNGKGIRAFGEGNCLKWSAHPDGGASSMAVWRALPEDDQLILEHLVRAISDADKSGENVHNILIKKVRSPSLSESVRAQVLGTNIWATHQALMLVSDDYQLLRFWSSVFDGVVSLGMQQRQAEEYAKKATFVGDGTIAVLPHNAPHLTGKLVLQKGAMLVVFSSELGKNRWALGVIRSARRAATFVDLAKHQEEIMALVPDIYIHPSGHLAGWTATAPLCVPREEFEKKRSDLIRAVIQVVGSLLPSRG
jgi:hypothetical protein